MKSWNHSWQWFLKHEIMHISSKGVTIHFTRAPICSLLLATHIINLQSIQVYNMPIIIILWLALSAFFFFFLNLFFLLNWNACTFVRLGRKVCCYFFFSLSIMVRDKWFFCSKDWKWLCHLWCLFKVAVIKIIYGLYPFFHLIINYLLFIEAFYLCLLACLLHRFNFPSNSQNGASRGC